ncbi:uncharacterized protein BX664DRAFT_330284 [Halteromyces radiatus]|uniref:uncharacterized protein n=1 Tax=Halteromyces radiatus TaxID=101107 RepID=UPI00221F0047|nr:uncharacterized protein BX664DRAFT_330284 [Halteromyces radiatus]KAI8093667.1 hypothetical protein BX664DRAFT_330284 [Halteromyces radiatus]
MLQQHYDQQPPPNTRSSPSSSISSTPSSMSSVSSFTWLVFLDERWTPFDNVNQVKLEQTLSLGGTFVDIADTNFPHVKRVRVFPRTNYLSYLGVKYRLSRIMQPDAWMDHT